MLQTTQVTNYRLKQAVFFCLGCLILFLSLKFFKSSGVYAQSNGPSFVEFESGLVRPLAISPDGSKLFATNTPNGTLEIFNITASGLTLRPRSRWLGTRGGGSTEQLTSLGR